MIPENLVIESPETLYQFLDDLTAYRRAHGFGRTPEAAYVREYCQAERKRVKAELKQRGLRSTRPSDTRTYGPGKAPWQRAGKDLPVQYSRGRSKLFKTEETKKPTTEITLIVRYRTSGGRSTPHTIGDGELVEVSIDGAKRRPAKTSDVNAAYKWLDAHGFKPAGFTWLDRAGYQRRRWQVYRKATQ